MSKENITFRLDSGKRAALDEIASRAKTIALVTGNFRKCCGSDRL